MVFVSEDIKTHLEALGALLAAVSAGPDHDRRLAAPGAYTRAVAALADLVDDLVGIAVIADRRSGARWADIGAGLGRSGESARARYGRRYLAVEWPHPQIPPGTPGAAPEARVSGPR